jgi:ParB-like chromosome segregation protein Spo0J
MSETISLLKPDKNNRRKHNERNIGMIVSSLQTVGASRSIVIDEDNNILAGNGTVEAAQIAGIKKLRIVDADGEEIIAVRRTGLTDEQKRYLAISDNRTAELATWSQDQLLQDIISLMYQFIMETSQK